MKQRDTSNECCRAADSQRRFQFQFMFASRFCESTSTPHTRLKCGQNEVNVITHPYPDLFTSTSLLGAYLLTRLHQAERNQKAALTKGVGNPPKNQTGQQRLI